MLAASQPEIREAAPPAGCLVPSPLRARRPGTEPLVHRRPAGCSSGTTHDGLYPRRILAADLLADSDDCLALCAAPRRSCRLSRLTALERTARRVKSHVSAASLWRFRVPPPSSHLRHIFLFATALKVLPPPPLPLPFLLPSPSPPFPPPPPHPSISSPFTASHSTSPSLSSFFFLSLHASVISSVTLLFPLPLDLSHSPPSLNIFNLFGRGPATPRGRRRRSTRCGSCSSSGCARPALRDVLVR